MVCLNLISLYPCPYLFKTYFYKEIFKMRKKNDWKIIWHYKGLEESDLVAAANKLIQLFAAQKYLNLEQNYEGYIFMHDLEKILGKENINTETLIKLIHIMLHAVEIRKKKSVSLIALFSRIEFSAKPNEVYIKFITSDIGAYFFKIWNGEEENIEPLIMLCFEQENILSNMWAEKIYHIEYKNKINDIVDFLDFERQCIRNNS